MKNKLVGLLQYFGKNLLTMVGIVMIWRGIWVLIDITEIRIFGSPNLWLTIGTIITGLLILYLPDKDLDEIKKL